MDKGDVISPLGLPSSSVLVVRDDEDIREVIFAMERMEIFLILWVLFPYHSLVLGFGLR
jgi:hypothetical protein